jgi:hypothetical protein
MRERALELAIQYASKGHLGAVDVVHCAILFDTDFERGVILPVATDDASGADPDDSAAEPDPPSGWTLPGSK